MFAIGVKAQARAALVALAGAVVEDGEGAPVVGYLVEAEIIPDAVGQERVDFDKVIGARAQAVVKTFARAGRTQSNSSRTLASSSAPAVPAM